MVPRRLRLAFTIVEMLVTVAICAVLTTLLIGGITQAQQNAQMTQCISRLRTLGSCLQFYSNDHEGALLQPQNNSTNRWPILLAPYLQMETLSVKNLYKQPIFKDPSQQNVSQDAPGIFGYNQMLETIPSGRSFIPVSSLTRANDFPLLATTDASAGGGLRLAKQGPPPKATKFGYTGATSVFGPSPNYGKKAIFLFADWHIEAKDVCNVNDWPWNDPQTFDIR